ncbi:MAG: hypothetical protein U1E67_08980 [Hyphomicrobiales bacterium]
MIANQFHLLRIEGRDDAKHVYGTCTSWAYVQAAGWHASYSKSINGKVQSLGSVGSGISHKKPFGHYLGLEGLKALLRAPISERLTGHGMSVALSELSAVMPQLKYITEELLDEALSDLGGELGFEHFRPASADAGLFLRRNRA